MTENREERGDPSGPGDLPGNLETAIPYLVMVGIAAVIGLVLTVYLWLNREEIIQILTQSPT